jgi:hypothetical protein
MINDLRDQLNQMQSLTSEKSAFMDFEEIMPANELNDYINLQKEIKRLQDDNRFLYNENQSLKDNQKTMSSVASGSAGGSSSTGKTNENLIKELNMLKERLKTDKDKHQQEIISLGNNYNQKLNSIMESHKLEIEKLSGRDDGWKDDGWSTLGIWFRMVSVEWLGLKRLNWSSFFIKTMNLNRSSPK